MQGGGWGGGSSNAPCCFMLWKLKLALTGWATWIKYRQTVPSVVNTLINSQNLFKLT